VKEKLAKIRNILCALSAGILITGCSNTKEDYLVPLPKVEPIPKENSIDLIISSVGSSKNIKESVNNQEITISAVGDCTLGSDTNFGTENTLPYVFEQEQEDYSYFFKVVYPILSTDDLTIANLETTLISEENYNTIEAYRVDKKFNFKGTADYANILTEGSVEVVNLANNHMHDYGVVGYEETKESLEKANISYFGYEDYKIYETKGIKIGLAGITGWNEETAKENTEQAIDYFHEKEIDIIIVSYHWGIEREYKQNGSQENIAKYAIDNGADLVLGHHPHVLQGIENYKGKYIAYSLGNFVFGGNKNPNDKDTMIFQITFQLENRKVTNISINIIPCSLSGKENKNDYQPRVLEGEEAQRVLKKVLNSSVNLKEE